MCWLYKKGVILVVTSEAGDAKMESVCRSVIPSWFSSKLPFQDLRLCKVLKITLQTLQDSIVADF